MGSYDYYRQVILHILNSTSLVILKRKKRKMRNEKSTLKKRLQFKYNI